MVAIQGIGGVPDPRPQRPSSDSSTRPTTASNESGAQQDGVVISSEAQAAAKIAGTIQAASGQSEIRTDRVEAARAAIANGDHQNPEVLGVVADRVSKLL